MTDSTPPLPASILVVDDDDLYALSLLQEVARGGHTGRRARCVAEALALAEEQPPDLVLLDIGLPDASGLSAIGPLKSVCSDPEIIVVTGNSNVEGAEAAIRSGAWDYLCKASQAHEISVAIQRALEYRLEKQAAQPYAVDRCGIVGQSSVLRHSFTRLAAAARTGINVLITGESGTGKGLFALAIHRNSARRGKGFVVADCATLGENLAESLLFGHRKGSFTGAVEHRVGLFEQAQGGTILLDEVGEMPLCVQKMFLRVLQERCFRPVGGDKEVPVDVRLIAATNRDLDGMVREGAFRQDLLFRLRAFTLELPPLRDRSGDISDIAHDTLVRTCRRLGVAVKGVSPEFLDLIEKYPWPGNVRELVHAMETAVAAALDHHTLYRLHLPAEIRVHGVRQSLPDEPGEPRTALYPSLRTFREHRDAATREYVVDLLACVGDDIERACAVSGLSRSRLYALIKAAGLRHGEADRPT